LDGPTFNQIESEIRDSVGKYIPNLQINTISITDASTEEGTNPTTTQDGMTNNTIALPGRAGLEYTAKVRIDYTITNNVFNQSDFIIINI
jgi:hypothetical protein